MKQSEGVRQLIHIGAGIFFLLFFLAFGRIPFIVLAFFLLVIGSLFIHFRMVGTYIPLIHDVGDSLERDGARFPGWGPALYLVGLLMIATVLQNADDVAAAILILGVSDGASTLVGLHGRHPLPYNRRKTVEGTLVFFFTSLFGYVFIGPAIVPLAFLAALAESSNVPIDDNLLVPLVSVIYLFIF